jgi:hypothetical protein
MLGWFETDASWDPVRGHAAFLAAAGRMRAAHEQVMLLVHETGGPSLLEAPAPA